MKILKLFLLIIFLTGCSKNYEYETLKPGNKIMAFGDSLTFGYGSEKMNYPTYLSQITGYDVVNYGINGDTTANGLLRLEEALQKEKPQLVILSLGGNDLLQRSPLNTIKENLHKMIAIIKKNNIQVVLLAEPQPRIMDLVMGESIISLNDADFYEDISTENNIYNIDKVYSTLLSEKENKSDLIHLNDQGYIKAAELIASQLRKEKII